MAKKLTVTELRSRYLLGWNGADPETGTEFKPADFQYHLDLGYAVLSDLLGMPIFEETVTNEAHDYYADDYERWMWLHLYRYPVISVTSVQGQFPQAQAPIVFPIEWAVVDKAAGHLQMIPTGGSIAQFMIGSTSLFLPLIQRGGYIPGFWQVTYQAGFDAESIPTDINDAAAKLASMSIANVLGDLIGGVGVLGASIGLDGLSEFLSLSKSATTSALYSRILAYRTELFGNGTNPRTSQIHILKRKYQGIRLLNL